MKLTPNQTLNRRTLFLPLAALALLALPTLANAQDLLVASYFGNYATDFSPNGANLGVFASSGAIARFASIEFDSNGYLYVAGNLSNNIRRFSPTGVDLGNFVTTGSGDAIGTAFDQSGNLYVSDFDNSLVRRFSPTGVDLGVFANVTDAYLMAFDSVGSLYVGSYSSLSSTSAATIHKFSSTGQDLGVFASGFSGVGMIAFDAVGNVYATNRGQNTVRRFSSTGVDLGVFASTGLADPVGLTFDTTGNLYVANFGGSTVRRFSSTGVDLGNFATGLLSPVSLAFRPSSTAVPEPGAVALLTGAAFCAGGVFLRCRRRQSR